jgi:hypothetical protein
MRSFLRQRYGEKTRLQLVTMPRGFLGRRLGFMGSRGGEMATAAVDGLLDAAAERSLWSRYGL